MREARYAAAGRVDKPREAPVPAGPAPESVTPKSVTPKSVTPKSVTPKSVTPKSVTPKSVTPKSVTQVTRTARTAGPTAAPDADELCLHRNMGGKTCQRPMGHAEKNHRYK